MRIVINFLLFRYLGLRKFVTVSNITEGLHENRYSLSVTADITRPCMLNLQVEHRLVAIRNILFQPYKQSTITCYTMLQCTLRQTCTTSHAVQYHENEDINFDKLKLPQRATI